MEEGVEALRRRIEGQRVFNERQVCSNHTAELPGPQDGEPKEEMAIRRALLGLVPSSGRLQRVE